MFSTFVFITKYHQRCRCENFKSLVLNRLIDHYIQRQQRLIMGPFESIFSILVGEKKKRFVFLISRVLIRLMLRMLDTKYEKQKDQIPFDLVKLDCKIISQDYLFCCDQPLALKLFVVQQQPLITKIILNCIVILEFFFPFLDSKRRLKDVLTEFREGYHEGYDPEQVYIKRITPKNPLFSPENYLLWRILCLHSRKSLKQWQPNDFNYF